MFTLRNMLYGVAVLLFAWYLVGVYLNRARSHELLKVIRDAARATGTKSTVKWFGRSAFQVEVGEPVRPFRGLTLLCLLEPRDFPLAQLWNRLRGRKDQVMIQADYDRAPGGQSPADPSSYGIAGLTGVTVRAERPHLLLTLQVGKGEEESIRKSFVLAAQFGCQRS